MAQTQARLQQIYREKIVPELMAKFGYKSIMEVPRLTKITLNMGVSEAVSDKKVMEHAHRHHGHPSWREHVRIPGPLRDDLAAARS